jgi:Fe-S-cluster containining protein
MIEKESIFLTPQQALEAVCIDFRRYAPQVMLFSEVLRVISGANAVIKQDREKEGRWVAAKPGSKMIWLDGFALGEYVCRMLHEKDYELDVIVSVCARVFQTRAFPGIDPANGRAGVYIETGMEGFSCRQCGDCCKLLAYHDALTAADVKLWERTGRQDILEWVGVFRMIDGEPTYRIWVVPGTGKLAEQCPFLKRLPAENRWICRIHDVKPRICRDYPVSRKHGIMTGCPGFSC